MPETAKRACEIHEHPFQTSRLDRASKYAAADLVGDYNGGLAKSAAYQIRDNPVRVAPSSGRPARNAGRSLPAGSQAINAAKAARLKPAESPNSTFDPNRR